ncbi:MAG: tetratricopeptide repeat protein, partial [Deltaproteobacteria bacterium]|nr:tetratricopeptide repeat protein [Deltaproteobacteria bacterium]
PANRLLGRAYQSIGRTSEAADLRARASGLPPYNPPADLMIDELVKESRSATFLLKQLGLARQGFSRPWAEFIARRAIEVDPHDADAVVALGLLMLEYARPNEALPFLDRFRELKPDDYQTMNNIGAILSHYGKLAKARLFSLEAIRINPKCAEAYSNLGMIYSMQGQQAEAQKYLLKALKLKPDNAEVLTNLGTVAGRQRAMEQAKDYYRKALQKDASFAAAHFGLGLLLAAQAKWPDAVEQYRRALKIRPDDINTLERLAWLLATCPQAKIRDGKKAVDLAMRANSISGGRDVRYLNTLAAAYAEAGDFDKARQTAGQALSIAQASQAAGLVGNLQARLALYEKDQAYHLQID